MMMRIANARVILLATCALVVGFSAPAAAQLDGLTTEIVVEQVRAGVADPNPDTTPTTNVPTGDPSALVGGGAAGTGARDLLSTLILQGYGSGKASVPRMGSIKGREFSHDGVVFSTIHAIILSPRENNALSIYATPPPPPDSPIVFRIGDNLLRLDRADYHVTVDTDGTRYAIFIFPGVNLEWKVGDVVMVEASTHFAVPALPLLFLAPGAGLLVGAGLVRLRSRRQRLHGLA